MLITRLARWLPVAVATGFAALAVVLAPQAVVVAAVLGLLAGLVAFVMTTDDPESPTPARGRAVIHGGTAAGVVAAAVLTVVGVVAVFGAAAAPILLVTGAIAAPWAYLRRRSVLDHRRVPRPAATPTTTTATTTTTTGRPPFAEPAAPARALAMVPTPALCARWHDTYHALHSDTSPPTHHELVALAELRRCYIDEFEQRDPAATARWMATESRPAATGPHRHLTDALLRPDQQPAPGNRANQSEQP